ncbi:site-specific integrase [Actinomadura napierensis]|uniref:Tyrosine-type recombinase/integrase n=1 Tax=Actinomadura napierensis TaxID=267854 RepID=A0ABN2XZE5_9ACTN
MTATPNWSATATTAQATWSSATASAALIDFDLARPTTQVYNIANALYWWAPAPAPPGPNPRPGPGRHPEALRGDPLPRIRFHDLRHEAAKLALLGKVDMKVISETLGHSRHSFTADTYTSVLPEVSRASAEAVAAAVPRISTDDVTAEPAAPYSPPNVVSLVDRRRRRTEHAG